MGPGEGVPEPSGRSDVLLQEVACNGKTHYDPDQVIPERAC